MAELTDDRNNPKLGYGVNNTPVPQNEAYLILSEEERSQGFVRPVRRTYIHVGIPGPKYELQDLTEEQMKHGHQYGYVKYEKYPEDPDTSVTGRYWTQEQLDLARECGAVTSMSLALAETYARDPKFYGATYCVRCQMHRPVSEFVWEDGTVLGT